MAGCLLEEDLVETLGDVASKGRNTVGVGCTAASRPGFGRQLGSNEERPKKSQKREGRERAGWYNNTKYRQTFHSVSTSELGTVLSAVHILQGKS